jgi:hypothetical protein
MQFSWVGPVAAILALLGVLRLALPFLAGLRAGKLEPELVVPLGFWGRARQGFWGLLACLAAGLLMLGLREGQEAAGIFITAALFLVLLPQKYVLAEEGLTLNGRLICHWEDFSGFFADPKYVVLFADHTARILWGQTETNLELLTALAKRLPRARNIARHDDSARD